MYKGITFALGACFIWGFIFVVPQMMAAFNTFEVALGRYSFYGAISFIILFKKWMQGTCRYPLSIWLKALYLSLASSFGYYIFIVLSIRYASPALCALVIGLSPILISFYGNWKMRECSFKSLIGPAILTLVGLTLINAPHLMESNSASTYLLGFFCSLWSLLAWCWYVVANSRFLKTHPEVCSSDWSTVLGMTTFFWSILFALVYFLFFNESSLVKFCTYTPELMKFLMGSAILGFLCSWVGAFLWNRACFYLPVSLAGQLTIFETIFGLIFVYTLDRRLPPYLECAGISLFLLAIVYGIRVSTKNTASLEH